MPADRGTFATQDRIDSWKSIAAFLARDERTVQRWEKERQLPVHRVPGERGSVFAYQSELTAWLNARPTQASATRPIPAGETDALPLEASQAEPVRIRFTESVVARNNSHQEETEAVSGPRSGMPLYRVLRHDYAWAGASFVAFLLMVSLLAHARVRAGSVTNLSRGEPTSASTSAATALSQPTTVRDPQARELYLQGRYYWSRRTGSSLSRALDAYTQAIVHDANYPEAYVGLAETYELMPQFGSMPAAEAYPRAISAAQRAMALQPASADAHRVLAFAQFYWQWKTSAALNEFRRAIELDPGNPETHHWYANALFTVRRTAEAKVEIEKARELNPSSRAIVADEILIDSGNGADLHLCVQQLRELERAEPDFLSPPRYLGYILLHTHDYGEWVSELKKYASLSQSRADMAVAQAAEQGWQRGGERGLFEALRKIQEKNFEEGQGSGYDLALTCLQLGDTDAALHFLQAAYKNNDFLLLTLVNDPRSSSLQGYAPYQQLRHEIELRGVAAN